MTEPLHSRSAGTPSGPEGPPRTAPAPALRSLLPPRSPSSVQSGMATSQALGTRHSHGNWLWLLPDLLKEQGQGTQVYAHSRIYFRIYTQSRVPIFDANQMLQGAFWRSSFLYCNPVPQQKDTCASRFLTYFHQVNPVGIYSHSCSLPPPVQVPS